MLDASPFSPTFPPDRVPIARKPSRPLPPGAWPVGEAVSEHPPLHHHHHPSQAQRNASAASSISSPVDSAYSPTRSTSFASQPFTALPIQKQRSGSVILSASPHDQISPRKQHRLSRSISASISPPPQTSPQRSPEDTARSRSLQKRPSESSASSQRRPTLRMISTSFAKGDSRRASEAVSQHSYGHSHGLGMGTPTAAAMASGVGSFPQPGHSPVAIYNHIHDTTNKRMATLEYLRKVHEGQVYYFSTVSYNSSNLSSLPSLNPTKLGRRATNYLLLGTSMTPLLEFYASSPLDYLRALASLLAEFDTYSQLSLNESGGMSFTKNRMGAMFKSGMRNVKGRRTSTVPEISSEQLTSNGSSTNLSSGLASFAESMPMPPVSNVGHDFQYLQLPSLPFDPDFGASFSTLTDILMEAYSGLLTLLSSPEACVPGVAEAFAKADKQMKKVMLGGIVNEFGESTRIQAKTEVGGLGKLVLSGLM
ncbi:hypothetical protein K461DRAFT_323015 [Myriangium duriaei CBS 260.36]|uniref:Uncharacterized protein n=1 Tax=Myriangium duriaei CBS 260.36 TaxID=1168546 RepID=A0A9P4IVA8_9PEZI|nr:hypothetical protein K461DRAFT_323015 [Myriangium duriaei CBS 260.36]